MKRDEEASIEVNIGVELDPINFLTHVFYVGHLIHINQFDEAIEKLEEMLKIEPNLPMAHRYLWVCYHQKGFYDRALEEAIKYFNYSEEIEIASTLSESARNLDYKKTMEFVAKKMEHSSSYNFIQPIWIARLYAYAGNKKRSLDWLNIAHAKRDPLMVNLRSSKDWEKSAR